MSGPGRAWTTRALSVLLLVLAACGAPSAVGQSTPEPTAAAVVISLVGAPAVAEVGGVFEVEVVAAGVTDLYGAELHLRFDPATLEVIDARGDAATKVENGGFLTVRFTAQNAVDQAEGRVDYAVTQMPPSKPATGDGALVRIRLRARAAGAAEIVLGDVLLASSVGEAIPWTSGAMGITVEIR